MKEMMEQISAQMEMLPAIVQYWVNWMGLVFIVSILFVWKKKAARFALLSMILTMAIGLGIFHYTETIHLLGVGHILFWAPLLYYLARHEITSDAVSLKSVYGVWLCLLMATISISLIFDVRDIVLVMMGSK